MVRSREGKDWDRCLMMETHYFLLELSSSILDDETKEMSGEGVGVGVGGSGGCRRF